MDALSVVVPIGPGECAWRALLPALRAGLPEAQLVCVASRREDLPEDGIVAPAGRAAQQNAGARGARGDWLWFLHADSLPEPNTLAALRQAIGLEEHIGYFDLRFADGPSLMRLNAIGALVRSRAFALPFGDQGLFMPRALFERLGGFDEGLAIGEDLDLVRRARAAGVRLRPAGAKLATSARRYVERGWLATTWRNVRLTVSLARAADRRIREARA